jgi:hypothetical protein
LKVDAHIDDILICFATPTSIKFFFKPFSAASLKKMTPLKVFLVAYSLGIGVTALPPSKENNPDEHQVRSAQRQLGYDCV